MDKYHLVLILLDMLTDQQLLELDQDLLQDFLNTFSQFGSATLDSKKLIETAMREFVANH